MGTMSLHFNRSIRMIYVWKTKFWTTVKACYSVSSRYVKGLSLLFFCHAPEKWGVRYPNLKKLGVRVPSVSPESYVFAIQHHRIGRIGLQRPFCTALHQLCSQLSAIQPPHRTRTYSEFRISEVSIRKIFWYFWPSRQHSAEVRPTSADRSMTLIFGFSRVPEGRIRPYSNSSRTSDLISLTLVRYQIFYITLHSILVSCACNPAWEQYNIRYSGCYADPATNCMYNYHYLKLYPDSRPSFWACSIATLIAPPSCKYDAR